MVQASTRNLATHTAVCTFFVCTAQRSTAQHSTAQHLTQLTDQHSGLKHAVCDTRNKQRVLASQDQVAKLSCRSARPCKHSCCALMAENGGTEVWSLGNKANIGQLTMLGRKSMRMLFVSAASLAPTSAIYTQNNSKLLSTVQQHEVSAYKDGSSQLAVNFSSCGV